MKIYLDDIRNPKSEGWTIVRTAKECIELIKSNKDTITEISIDNDLGEGDYEATGYDVAKFIEAQCWCGFMKCPKFWNVHSANPVGAKNITMAMKNAEIYSKGEF
jgi:hypothetical protein